jgi:hypothetical protein
VLTIDLSEFKAFAKDLDLIQKRSIPYAVRDTLNGLAFEVRKLWIAQMGKDMVLRSKWTQGSIRIDKATGATIAGMQATLGSLAPYMHTQEQGGTESAGARKGVPIPTTSAAGQAMKARPRTRQVQRKNWLSAIQLRNRVTGIRQRRNAVAIAQAAKTGGVAFLDLGRRKGLFRVTGTPKGRLRIRMVWDLSKRSVKIPRNPTLERTVATLAPRVAGIGQRAITEQMKRAVFGTRR